MDASIEQFRSDGGHETYAVASSDDVGRTEQGIGAEDRRLYARLDGGFRERLSLLVENKET